MKFSTSDIIASVALVVAAWTLVQTIVFNRRQERFEKTNQRLNLLLIERERADVLEGSQADISARFYKAGRNDYRLKIFNRGKASARKLDLKIIDDGGMLIDSEVDRKFPVPVLEPQSAVELIAAVHLDSAARAHLQVTWEDLNGDRRTKDLYPTL